ncbi:MAG: Gfo/Idh/MocA family oxidoreductase [bacterium]|nr:Gfo/Idh/MocA family oxidoreductase [bacterium]
MKLGVIGCGHLGSIHARVYSEIPGIELLGVYDIKEGAAGAVADKLGCRCFGGAEQLAAEADALSICVPTTVHYETAMLAMERDCHLLVEKPIASTIGDAEKMVEEADKRGLKLMVGHVERFNPAMIAALPYLKNVGFVESHRLAPFAVRGAEVAVVLDLMIHDIDLLTMVIGADVSSLDASGTSVLTHDIDIANARLSFSSGCVANITASRISRDRMRKIRFFQTDSYLSIDLFARKIEMYRKAGDFMRRLATAQSSPAGMADIKLEDFIEAVEIEVPAAEPLRLELEAFTDAVADKIATPVSGADGLRALKLAMEILEKVKRVS